MPELTVPPRSAIAPEHTWNAPSVFATVADWEAELKQVGESLPGLTKFKDHLADGPGTLADLLEALEAVFRRMGKVFIYASMSHAVDTTDQAAAGRYGQSQAAFGQAIASVAFLDPELIAIGQTTLNQWLKDEPRLALYQHYVDDLFRRQAHVRSAEVEELLGLLSEPFASTYQTASMLTDSDMKFAPARSSTGTADEVTQGSIDKLLASPDRETRRTAWESYADTYLAFKNTLANNLASSIKRDVFEMRARKHPSTLESSVFENAIPSEVFRNLITTFKANLSTWHRYWAVRRKALGVDTLNPYDIWAPLTQNPPAISYAQSVEWICEGLKPLGEDYVNVMRQGCGPDRWVDIYPNQGKTSGAFSSGRQGTHPFILMSYDDTIFSLSTLAHELGHSMHSYLTWKHQPAIYADYSLFLAEVASNFHQAMVRAHLLNTNTDRDFQISVIEEAMSNFHRYFFIMPTLARFELEMHERAEHGEGLTADIMNERMADLFSEGYGNEMHVDRARVGITWAQFSHLYADYYVYQYATGISGANAFARRILAGTPGAAEAYRTFLQSGSSRYPLETLKQAGLDLASPKPVEEAFAVLAGLVDRLEGLVGKSN